MRIEAKPPAAEDHREEQKLAKVMHELAVASAFKRPPDNERLTAQNDPLNADEGLSLVLAYSGIKMQGTRQALLDLVVAINIAENRELHAPAKS